MSDMVVERPSTSAILILLSWWLAVVSSNGILPLYPRPGKIELANQTEILALHGERYDGISYSFLAALYDMQLTSSIRVAVEFSGNA